ncbi:MAG TPA: glycoside hydrolase family 2 TIM barrel-domain containing protein [Tepidisphaeraceae bacterium]|nr:glycoside hydrolase family 2 TIM barrel-domain containing protein [Tepidisphaeraceae bacterium]
MIHRAISLALVLLVSTYSLGQGTQRQYLSGKGIDDAVPWDFMVSAGNQSGKWAKLPVPSCWDMQGFGTLTYGRKDPQTGIPASFSNEQGKYKRTFSVPANWRGQDIFLVFEGAMTDAEAWVNGKSAGPKHQGAYYRFKYDITSLVSFDADNLLEVTVDKESSNPSVVRAELRGDYWDFGGLFRPVYLEAMPTQHIDRVAIDAKADGTFAMDVFSNGNGLVEADIGDSNGRAVGRPISGSLVDGKAHLVTRIDAPKLWTAETPNLYNVSIKLGSGHQMLQKFGFRTIEVRPGDGVYVNGQRIMLKGTCRHSFWPESGRATSERISRLDVAVMKEMNNNAVRMSHYPPDEHFLEACDEMGLYVLDELGGWHGSYDTPTGRGLIQAMVTRDVNHPCILFWDNGNEGGWNTALDDDFANWDPQKREVLHPQQPFRNVNTRHYPTYKMVQDISAGDTVFFPTEFLHGLFDGGLGAGLEEYWQLMTASKVTSGGFLWSYVDETVKRVDQNGKMDGAGNQAPDGIVGPYREKEGSFYAVKQIWSPIQLKYENGNLAIANHYDFTNATQCVYTMQLRKFHGPQDQDAGSSTLYELKLAIPDIPPHGQGSIKLELPDQASQADALAVRVDDPNGKELWTWVWPLAAERKPVVLTDLTNSKITSSERMEALDVNVGDLSLRFNIQTGFLTSAKRGDKVYPLSNGPRLASGTATFDSIERRPDGDDFVVKASYTGNMNSITWRVKPDGWLLLDYTYYITEPRDYFGVSFDMPEQEIKSKKWLGNGPFRVWRNRTLGGTLNVWENAYNNTMTGYTDWVYPEFKGYFSDVRWMQFQTSVGPMLAVIDDPNVIVQALRPQFPGDPKVGQNAGQALSGNAWAPFPNAGFSLLHGIPAIGSKFVKADTTGATGQQPMAMGEYHGSARFYFGQ